MFIKKALFAAALAGMVIPVAVHAQATEPYISEIIIVPYNFCPRGYIETSGQLVSIAQNTALFSLLGTAYGGNGQTTFALPDLRGRTMTNAGQGPGLSARVLGEGSGSVSVTLVTANLPAHSHAAALRAYSSTANSNDPTSNTIARSRTGRNFYSTAAPNVDMRAGDIAVSATGSGQAIQKTSPSLGLRHCIALEGAFPPRP